MKIIKNLLKKIEDFISDLKKIIYYQEEKIEGDKEANSGGSINSTEKAKNGAEEIINLEKEAIEIDEEILKTFEEQEKTINQFQKNYSEIEPLDLDNIDFSKFTIIISDDHLGSLKSIITDIKMILKNETQFSSINSETLIRIKKIKEKFESLYGSFYDINLITFNTDYAPYIIEKTLEKYPELKPNIAILDIIYGGFLIKDKKNYILDGVDIAEKIVERSPNCLIDFYTGCDLNKNSAEANKINNLSKKTQVHITDKDIDDNHRLKPLIRLFESFLDTTEKEE